MRVICITYTHTYTVSTCRVMVCALGEEVHEVNSNSACQEIHHLLWHPTVYQRVHSSPSLSMPWRWTNSKVSAPRLPKYTASYCRRQLSSYATLVRREIRHVEYRLHRLNSSDLWLRTITTLFIWLPFRHLLKSFDSARSKPTACKQVFASRYDPLTTHSCSPTAFRNLYVYHIGAS